VNADDKVEVDRIESQTQSRVRPARLDEIIDRASGILER
jgi:hypothetical protein